MSKKIIDRAITGLILTAIFEVGVILGINLVKSGIFYAPFSLTTINGIPKAFIVTSGSMEPTIKTGGLVLSIPLSTYNPGDIVTYENSTDHKTLVTHRIVSEDNQMSFITKGDANNTGDETKINKSQIIGKAVIAFPQLGYFANSIKDPKMFILLVIVPATIVIYEELKFLKKQILKKIGVFLNKFKADEDNGSNKLFVFIPVFAIAFILAGITGSFFTDSITHQGFNLNTGTFAPPPHIVINEVFTNGGNTGATWKGQYIELYNQSASPVNVSGWTISDLSGPNTIPTSSPIPVDGFAVIVGNQYNGPSIPSSAIRIVLGTQKIGSNGLDGIGDFVQLKDGTIMIDQMSYGTNTSAFPTPPPAPSSTQTVHRNPNGVDTNTSVDWTITGSTTIGTGNL